jgi:hypothetical protein
LQIALGIETYIISSGIYDIGASVLITNLQIMSLLTSHTAGGITNYMEHSAMSTAREPMPNSLHAIFTENSKCSTYSQ